MEAYGGFEHGIANMYFLTLGLFLVGVFALEIDQRGSVEYARVSALSTMVSFQIFHVGNCRSEEFSAFRKRPFSNRFLFYGTAVVFLAHVGALYFGPTQSLLRLEPLSLETGTRIVVIALSVIFVGELHKLVRRSHPVRACRRPTLTGS